MRNSRKSLVLGGILALLSIFCAKSDDKSAENPGATKYSPTACTASTCATTPAANALNDNAAKGLYKGVITGSTANFEIDYDNALTSSVPKFKYTYIPDNMAPCSQTINGSAAVTSDHTLTFNGTCYLPFTLVLVLSPTGAVNSATFTINSITKTITLKKELSTTMIRSWEGTATGNLNAILGSSAVSTVWNLTTVGESQAEGYSPYAGTLPLTSLDGAKKLSFISPTSACPNALSACSCATTAASNEGFLYASMGVTGTWSLKLTATCATLPGAPVGWIIASGTWTGTRTR